MWWDGKDKTQGPERPRRTWLLTHDDGEADGEQPLLVDYVVALVGAVSGALVGAIGGLFIGAAHGWDLGLRWRDET